eukprot:scaffold725_cov162-Ochromonas_danica.AAC.2
MAIFFPMLWLANTAVDLQHGKVVTANPNHPSQLPPWIEAILFIRLEGDQAFPSSTAATIRCMRPEDCNLSSPICEDILSSCLRPMQSGLIAHIDEKFMFRVRDKSLPGSIFRSQNGDKAIGTAVSVATVFYNCFCHYQYFDSNTPLNNQLASGKSSISLQASSCQQAMVIVSRWPFPQLAFRLLEQLDEALLWQAREMHHSSDDESENSEIRELPSDLYSITINPDDEFWSIMKQKKNNSSQLSLGSVGIELDNDIVANVLSVAHSQSVLWPPAIPGTLAYFHAFGDTLSHIVEADIASSFVANMPLTALLSSLNLISVFGPLGLVQHIWSLWEILVTGQDIVVIAPNAAMCSNIALGLASLLIPAASVGDIRPFIRSEDSDVLVLAATAQLKNRNGEVGDLEERNGLLSRGRAMIVGGTESSLLSKLEDFSAALFIYPLEVSNGDESSQTTSVWRGLRTQNAADYYFIGEDKAAVNTDTSFGKCYQKWLEKGTRKSALVCRKELSTVSMPKMLQRIKKLSGDDRCALGDQLLRDHLRTLTAAYFSPPQPIASVHLASRVDPDRERKEFEKERERLALLQIAEEKGMLFLGLDDLRCWLIVNPSSCKKNLPMVAMWVFILVGYAILYVFGMPPLFIVAAGFLLPVPERAPAQLEDLVNSFFPQDEPSGSVQERNVIDQETPNNAKVDESETNGERMDLSGVWKRVKLENYENFLAVQGASYVQRKLASSISMVHTITMSQDLSVFRLQEKGGPIDSDVTYLLDGTEIATATAKNTFLDQARWKGSRLVIRKLKTPEENYELIVSRWLINNGKTLKTEAKYHELKTGKEVVAHIEYELVGPSPHSPPEAIKNDSSPIVVEDTSEKRVIQNIDLSGVWQRTKTHNFEAFIGATGAGFMQRKLAAQMALTHTITMDPPALKAFRLQEKGGPINLDNLVTIGADFQAVELNGRSFLHKAYWQDGALVLQRRAADGSFEMVLTRTLEVENSPDEPKLILKSVHRDLQTGKEVEATSWFNKTGPSPNLLPVPDSSLLPPVTPPSGVPVDGIASR